MLMLLQSHSNMDTITESEGDGWIVEQKLLDPHVKRKQTQDDDREQHSRLSVVEAAIWQWVWE